MRDFAGITRTPADSGAVASMGGGLFNTLFRALCFWKIYRKRKKRLHSGAGCLSGSRGIEIKVSCDVSGCIAGDWLGM